MSTTTNSKTKVAIIGTGLAGLTTAYLLQNDDKSRYAVTLFEQSHHLSFDSASVTVKNAQTGAVERIDLPMRATAGGYYVQLMRMYSHLGIVLHPLRFLFIFSKAASPSPPESGHHPTASSTTPTDDPSAYFIHSSNLHQIPPPRPSNRSLAAHLLEILFLLICNVWFTAACFLIRPITSTDHHSESLGEYLARIRLPQRYVSQYLLPLMSSVSTCSHHEQLAFPASDVVEYKRRSHGQQHYTVCGGVTQVQEKLAEGVQDVRLSARVLQVVPGLEEGGLVRWMAGDEVCEEMFDRVVLAVSPDVAASIFEPLGRQTLGKIPTVQVESSVLSSSPGGGCRVIGHDDDDDEEGVVGGCMHHLEGETSSAAQSITLRTQFSGLGSRTEALHAMPSGIVVGTCPLDDEAVEMKKRQLKVASFTRTLRTTESRALVERVMGRAEREGGGAWTNGEDDVWLVGAWCWDGMVLLEGCVVSAMKVADDFGVRIPWRVKRRGGVVV